MRTGALALAGVLLGCTKPNPLYCDTNSECDTGYCDVAIHTCSEPIDAPSTIDSPIPTIDADRTPDADTTVPIVQTYQAADLVLGQSTFDADVDGGCTGSSFTPLSIHGDNGVLYIGDRLAQRVLVWAPLPTTSNVSAIRVIAQPDLTTCGRRSISQNDVWDYPYVAAGSGKVVVTDWFRHRILVWNPPPVGNNENADLVLGQATFLGMTSGAGASQLNSPEEVWTDGTRLVAVDRYNHRVLIWTSFPTTNGEAADLVIGKSGFGLTGAPASPTASNLNTPRAVWSDGTRQVVADRMHRRVLIWNTFPTTNGQSADVVVGQSDFTSSASGVSATAMSAPLGVVANADALFVSDNDRVLVFAPFPTTSGAAATYVLGQPDFTTGGNNPGPTQQSLDGPSKLAIVGNHLWVADQDHERALRFTLYP
jgi:hypothetical protein